MSGLYVLSGWLLGLSSLATVHRAEWVICGLLGAAIIVLATCYENTVRK